MKFFLGTHEPHWLDRARGPLFVSRRRLNRLKPSAKAVVPWALDSGGFSELSMFGKWETGPDQYAAEVARYSSQLGGMEWAAVQDWMCEPFIIKKTGLSVRIHQGRTIQSYYDLHARLPSVQWVPVIQGFTLDEYLNHIEQYRLCGIDLRNVPVVGVGSICRRQATREATRIIRAIHHRGIRIHGFGFKLQGLRACARYLHSADSMAWSFDARRKPPLPGHKHKACSNCLDFAEDWRRKALASIDTAMVQPEQQEIDFPTTDRILFNS